MSADPFTLFPYQVETVFIDGKPVEAICKFTTSETMISDMIAVDSGTVLSVHVKPDGFASPNQLTDRLLMARGYTYRINDVSRGDDMTDGKPLFYTLKCSLDKGAGDVIV